MAQTESIFATTESITLHRVVFLTESILRTTEFNVAYIKSIFIESWGEGRGGGLTKLILWTTESILEMQATHFFYQ